MALPFGILVAIYVNEFAPQPSAARVSLALDVLNGIPAIVIGIFVFGLIVVGHGQSALCRCVRARRASCCRSSRARRWRCSRSCRTRCARRRSALGAPRWRTTLGIVLPQTIGGIAHRARRSRSRASPARPRRCCSRRRSSARRSTGTRVMPLQTVPVAIFELSDSPDPARPRARLGGGARADRCSSSSRASRHAGSPPAVAASSRREQMSPMREEPCTCRVRSSTPCASRRSASRCRRASGSNRSSTSRTSTRHLRRQSRRSRTCRWTIYKNLVTAIIGPSGCGKSTFIRCLNRMNDLDPGLPLDRDDPLPRSGHLPARTSTRSRCAAAIGMVFQRPNPFPKSIYDNVAWGLQVLGMKDNLDDRVEQALDAGGALGRGEGPAEGERARPLRRPAAAPLHRARDRRRAGRRPAWTSPPRRSTRSRRQQIEELDARAQERVHVRDRHAQHAAGRARRRHDGVLLDLARRGGRRWRGASIEYDATEKIFTRPSDKRTEDYVTGRSRVERRQASSRSGIRC